MNWEQDWLYHVPYQATKKLPHRSAPGQNPVDHDFLRPFTIASGELRRGMMRNNEYPGEEGRVALVDQGKEPPRSAECKMIQRTTKGEA
eukprot:3059610-Pyramimonas_sp.AAC.1